MEQILKIISALYENINSSKTHIATQKETGVSSKPTVRNRLFLHL